MFSNGRILCWGDGTSGRLGQDSTTSLGADTNPLNAVQFIEFSDTVPATYIGGSSAVCAVFANRRVRCWGDNSAQQLGDGSGTGDNSIQSAVYMTFAATINTIPIIAVDVGG